MMLEQKSNDIFFFNATLDTIIFTSTGVGSAVIVIVCNGYAKNVIQE